MGRERTAGRRRRKLTQRRRRQFQFNRAVAVIVDAAPVLLRLLIIIIVLVLVGLEVSRSQFVAAKERRAVREQPPAEASLFETNAEPKPSLLRLALPISSETASSLAFT